MRLSQISLLPLALVVSLGLNVFVAGWLVGDRAGRFGPPPPPPGSMQPFLDSLESRLSPEGARIMDTTIRGFKDRSIRHFRRLEEIGERMEKALVGGSFDRARFLATAQELSSEQAVDRSEVAEQIATAIEKLSPEDRKHLSEMRPDHGPGGGVLRYLPGMNFQGPRR
jgi:uncharacterized membrane protein